MLSTRKLFSAKVALQGQPRDAFPSISRTLLAEGHDGPAMRQLAALEGAGSWTDGDVLNAALAEIGSHRISKRLAALRLAQDLATNELSNGELAFPSFPAMLYRLWIASDYIDDLVFVDSFDPNWSVYFENENAAKTALKLSLERLAALNVSDGEPAPPPPKPQSFRSLIAPIEGVVPATGPSIVSSAYAGLTFRERWRAARQEDEGLLRWVAAWGLFLIGYYYCRAVGGPGFKQLDTFFHPNFMVVLYLCQMVPGWETPRLSIESLAWTTQWPNYITEHWASVPKVVAKSNAPIGSPARDRVFMPWR